MQTNSNSHPNLDYGIYLPNMKNNLSRFFEQIKNDFVDSTRETTLLDIGPSEDEVSISTMAKKMPLLKVTTLDVIEHTKPDLIGDITRKNENIEDEYFDYVTCMEVLEHTRTPWTAPAEIMRILKPKGYAFISTPFNLVIHPPLPDYWRFTEYGLRELFKDFEIVEIRSLLDRSRLEMPVQYTTIVRKK